MRFVSTSKKTLLPALGIGTWRMGESARTRDAEITAVRTALELGYRLIDTAEMYGEGGAEEVVGAALQGAGPIRREELFIVSKVYPHNASRRGVAAACERSLKRLTLDYVDLYLLHWRGEHPLAETIAGFESLREHGRIRHWGVSNFDVADMQELWSLPPGSACLANQVYYSASTRGIEFDLLPWQRTHRVITMAYSPIDEGALARDPLFVELGRRHGVAAASVALAWVLRQPDVIAIPKAASIAHLRENAAALDLTLSAEDLTAIDARFAPPRRRRPLAMR
jgi:diketogulonate reductase-like aldo/keto reductase